jgi:dipeptidase
VIVRNSRKPLRVSRVKAHKNEQASEQGSSSFHLSIPQNAAEYHMVKVVTQQGAPTIQATILGTLRSFIVDTGRMFHLLNRM